MTIKKQHGSKSKARVALEALRGEKTLSEIGRAHGIHPIQVGKWRKEVLERAHELFTDKRRREEHIPGESTEELLQQIGRLKVENDFLKKKTGFEF